MRYNPNEVKRLSRQEGLKDADLVFDDQDIAEIEMGLEMPNVEKRLDGRISSEQLDVLKILDAFTEDSTLWIRHDFVSLLKEFAKAKRNVSPAIMEFLESKQLLLPKYIIARDNAAEELLEEYQLHYFGDQLKQEKALLVSFQLPKPVAQFWWKGGVEGWGAGGEDVGGQVLEWGEFYRSIMHVVWDRQGFFENEKGLCFERVNDIGQHDPGKYYYVWVVGKWKVK